MIWRGCLFLLIVFGAFGASLYGLYSILSAEETDEQLVLSTGRYEELLSLESDLVEEVIRLKAQNYPHNQGVASNLDQRVEELSSDQALSLLGKIYLQKPLGLQQLDADGLKGLTLKNCGDIGELIAAEDEEKEFALLQAHLLKDGRQISHVGLEEWASSLVRLYEQEYFDFSLLSVTLEKLSEEASIDLAFRLSLLAADSSFKTEVPAQLAGTLMQNTLSSKLEKRAQASRRFERWALSSGQYHSQALFELYQVMGDDTPDWHKELFSSLVLVANDDIIADFLALTPYIEPQWGGLYISFRPESLQSIPQEIRQLLSEKLGEGMVSFAEARAIEDLARSENEVDEYSLLYYSDLIDEDPENPMHFFERARILADQYGDHQRAIEDYDQSLELDGTNSDAYFHRSLSKEKLNDIEGSIADYDKVLLYDPDNVYALGNRGIMKHEVGDYAGAIADYSETLSLDSTYVDALYGRALSRAHLGDTLGALEDYGGSILMDSYYLNAYINRALIFLELSEDERALDDYLKVLEIENDHLDGLYGTAYAYYQMDSLEHSANFYRKISVDYPSEVGAFYSLGVVYNDLEEFQNAYNYFTKSIFMDSTYSDAYLQRGLTSLNLGDTIDACLDWVYAKNAGVEDASTYLNLYCKN